jgi:hypothetical protein
MRNLLPSTKQTSTLVAMRERSAVGSGAPNLHFRIHVSLRIKDFDPKKKSILGSSPSPCLPVEVPDLAPERSPFTKEAGVGASGSSDCNGEKTSVSVQKLTTEEKSQEGKL